MKWVVASMNASSIARAIRTFSSMSRMFAIISVSALCFLFVTGLYSMAQNKWNASTVSPMRGAASSLSASFFLDMLAMEMPYFQGETMRETFSASNTVSFLFRYLTNIQFSDPRSLLASEMPGMRTETSALLYPGQATQPNDYPADFTPPPDVFRPAPEPAAPDLTAPPPQVEPAPVVTQEPKILIYHTHNRESFLPELKGVKDPDLAYDTEINITLVGKTLSESLESAGIPVMLETTDYPTAVQGFNYAKSYAYSAKTVQEAFKQNGGFDMVFDLHRDALSRDRTTATINGTTYAQVYFVVGKKNPNWEKNSDFANRIHTLLEKKHPGISRGIFGKASNGNGEYNQSLSPNSILLEIGGPYNTLEEMNRTARLLGEVIAELYNGAVKADNPNASPPMMN